jgi:hypothetical protein
MAGGHSYGGRTVGDHSVGGRMAGGRFEGGRITGGRSDRGRMAGGRSDGGRMAGGRSVGGGWLEAVLRGVDEGWRQWQWFSFNPVPIINHSNSRIHQTYWASICKASI